MRTSRRGLVAAGLGMWAAFTAGCAQEPKAPLEPTAGTEKAVLVAEGMH